jgi:two-component system, NarL family, invasion response regulator UvrY
MKPPLTYKIILADDHIVLRDALANLMQSFEGCSVVALASNGTEVIEALEKGARPDIIILDLNMPRMDGYETTRWLASRHPEIKILILTMYDSEIAMIRLLQEGVRGFLKKDIHPSELKNAILQVAEDGYYYANAATNKLAVLFKKDNNSQSKLEKAMFNETEIEFLKMVSTDMTYKEIAIKMQLTTRVIDSYRDALFEKLDVKSRVGLVIYAIKKGIVSF